MSKKNIFIGGIPTGPDVRKIRQKYPDNTLSVGTTIEYKKISALIGHEPGSYRFKTVTSAWRKVVEKESAIFIGTNPGVEFVVLNEREKLDLAGSKYRHSLRASRRANIVASHVNRKEISEEEATRLDFIDNRSAAILSMARLKKTPILPEV
jgi:hypothetical protein